MGFNIYINNMIKSVPKLTKNKKIVTIKLHTINKEVSMKDELKLKSQICFPLYVCSKEVIRKYKPLLDEVNLTYTQFITLLALWEDEKTTVNELGKKLYLDSGTLTPLLKKLEMKDYIFRNRSANDERNVYVTLTEEGKKLKDKCRNIPSLVYSNIGLSSTELQQLYVLLYKIMNNIDENIETQEYNDLL